MQLTLSYKSAWLAFCLWNHPGVRGFKNVRWFDAAEVTKTPPIPFSLQIHYKKGHDERKAKYTSLADTPEMELAKKVSNQRSDVSCTTFQLHTAWTEYASAIPGSGATFLDVPSRVCFREWHTWVIYFISTSALCLCEFDSWSVTGFATSSQQCTCCGEGLKY